MKTPTLVALAMSLALSPIAQAQSCSVRSGPVKNALVELYTSEGCSSCPPADRWLSAMPAPAGQPQVVPVAFHISYWDDLGWKDAYADPRFTERQRTLARAARRAGVYTPQVIIDGHDFPAWYGASTPASLQAVSKRPAKATLEITQSVSTSGLTARVGVELASQPSSNLSLVVVMTESRLGSRVTAGENRGETLRHDFVARDLRTFPLRAAGEFAVRFDGKPAWKPGDTRLVAFVQDDATGEVLQALAGCGAS
jgi:hypothetical protein